MNIQRAGSLACLLCLFLCASLFVSCDDEDLSMRTGDMSALGFSVSSDGNASSDGATRAETHVVDSIELEGNTFYLTCTVTDIDESAATRGTIISTDNLSSVYGQFNVSAYKNGILSTPLTETDKGGNALTSPASYVDVPYVFDKNYTDASSATYQLWKTSSTGSFHWPLDQSVPLTFYAYAPTSAYTGTASWAGLTPADNFKADGKIEFDYTVPTTDMENSYKRVDAECQPDILVTSIPSIKRTDSRIINVGEGSTAFCIVPLTFYHALSAVNFKVGADLKRNITIKRLKLFGLKASGTCTFDPSATTGSQSADYISWDFTDVTDNTGSYCQTYDYEVPATAPATDPALGSASQTFMLIPQTFGPSGDAPEAKVTITYNDTYARTKTVSLHCIGDIAWRPGKKYTYTLTGDLKLPSLGPYEPGWWDYDY